MSEESSHWYLRDGTPCHQIKGKSGNVRGFNLRWDRALKAVPSTTTVLKIIAKPALENWKVEQGILSALTLPRVDGESERQFLKRVKEDSWEQAKKAAEEGNRIHQAIDCHFKGMSYSDVYKPHVDGVLAELARIFPDVTDWVAEKSFAHPMGFGGSCDLHSPSTGICADHKGKDGELWSDDCHAYARVMADGEVVDKRCDYDQNYQLGSYQVGLRLRGEHVPLEAAFGEVNYEYKPCANIFVSRTHPGHVTSRVWTAEEISYGWDVFEAALRLWKILNGYDGSF